jgi:hypothetical protein
MSIIEIIKKKLFNFADIGKNLDGFREFYSIEDAKIWGKKYYSKAPEENIYSEVEQYCGYLFNPINAVLRREDLSWYEENAEERYQNRIQIIKPWLYSFKLPEDIIVYRAISKKHLCKMKLWSKEKFGDSKNILYEYGFLSTSLVFVELKKLHPDSIYLKIYLLKGTTGAYVDLISKRSEEQEFLIPPGARLYVLKKTREVYTCVLMQE